MKIVQTNVNIVYPRINDYRKKFVLSEEKLSENFQPANILSVPEEIQPEVPRIVANTKGGHSVLSIALTVSSLTTNYTDKYVYNWDKCESYIKNRCESVYDIVNDLTDGSETFVGLITSIRFDELPDYSLKILKDSLFKDGAKNLDNPIDAECKFTYICKDTYYINIKLENVRQFNDLGNHKISENKNDSFINVTLDVNDRYAVNTKEEYHSNVDAFNDVLSITSNIIKEKLNDLVFKGIYKNDTANNHN